jgi:soluble lytic murein transglycosylase
LSNWSRRALVGLLLNVVVGASAAQLSDSEARHFSAAYESAKTDRWDAAQREAGALHGSALADAIRWIVLERGGGSVPDIASFIAAHPDWPGQTQLLRRAEEELGAASDSTAIAWFADHPPLTPAGKLRQAELWLDHGNADAGAALIRDVWINGDFSTFDEKSFLQRYHAYLRTADHVQRLDRLLWDGNRDEAKRMLPRVPQGEQALAEARLALAALEPGAEHLIARVPASLQHDQALLYERVRWRRRNEHYDDAIALLGTAPADPVRPEAWAVEREILARYALADGNAQAAYRIASEHRLTTGAHFAELEFLAGWVALRFLHQPDMAYDHFVRLYDQVELPISRARGAYCSARAAEEMNYHQLADSWYATAAEQITTYYGQLAAAQIGAPGASLVVEPQPTEAEAAAFEARDLVKATRAFARVGGDEVAPFLRHLSEHAAAPAEHALVARLAVEIQRPDLAVAAAKRASYAGVTLLAEGFPLESVPPGGAVERPLVLAMTRQESAFDTGAVSSAGARGLMQLMPATARNVAKSLGMKFSAARLTGDSRYNLTLGREYLSGLLDGFAGSYVLSVAAYNAGPARVHEWIASFGDPRARNVDAIDWIESIPIAETRNYVQRVLENLQVYRFRLGDTRLAFSLPTDLQR